MAPIVSTPSIHWGVHNQAVIAIAYWEPEGPAMEDDPIRGTSESTIGDPEYILVRTDYPRGKGFAWGGEPAIDDWAEELLGISCAPG